MPWWAQLPIIFYKYRNLQVSLQYLIKFWVNFLFRFIRDDRKIRIPVEHS